jgi:hypothetical protein
MSVAALTSFISTAFSRVYTGGAKRGANDANRTRAIAQAERYLPEDRRQKATLLTPAQDIPNTPEYADIIH